jgi:hypothetical protein
MSQNEEVSKNKPKNNSKEKVNLDNMNNNDKESYLILKHKKIKIDRPTKKKRILNFEEIKNNEEDIPDIRTRKRSDSVDLYKKKRREREREKEKEKENKNKKESKKESTKNIKINNSNIYNISENVNTRKSSKSLKNGKEKKVSFSKNFVTIIDVESYKKFNEENTCKDPFEDLEFLEKIKNGVIRLDEEEEPDGKARVNCSCFIY